MEPLELIAHFQAQLGIQVGQGLVHEQYRGLRGQGTGNGHALLLAAGQLRRIPVHEHADLDDAADPADGQVDLLFGQLPGLHDDFPVLAEAELSIQGKACVGRSLPARCNLGLQLGDLTGAIGILFQMIAEEGLGGVLGDGEGINELQNRLFLLQLAVLIPALLQNGGDIGGVFQDLGQAGGVFGLKIHLGQGLLDIGQAERDILIHGHIGPQGVVLEQEAHLALVGRHVDAHITVENHLVADGDFSAGGGLQAGDHPQRGSFAAAGWAQQGDESVVFNGQVQVLDGIEFAPTLGNVLQFDFRHLLILLFLCRGLRPSLCLPGYCTPEW